MALAKKCDRCGNFYDPKTIKSAIYGYSFNGLITVDRAKDNDRYCICETVDLCPKCLESFNHWFENKPEPFTPDLCWPVEFDTSKHDD